MRTTGPNGLALIRHVEGVCDRVYLDNAGNPTGGCGHLMLAADLERYPLWSPVPGEQVNAWLHDDLARTEGIVNRHCPDLPTQNAFDALVDFTFQEGEVGLQRLLQDADGTPGGIAEQFQYWTRSGHTHPRGIIIRRALDKLLFLAPDGPMPEGWLTSCDHLVETGP